MRNIFIIIFVAMILVISGIIAFERSDRVKSCQLELDNWITPKHGLPEHVIAVTVDVQPHGVIYNERKVSEEELYEFFSIMGAMNPIPFPILNVSDGADCKQAVRIKAAMDKHLKCSRRRCGTGQGWRYKDGRPLEPTITTSTSR